MSAGTIIIIRWDISSSLFLHYHGIDGEMDCSKQKAMCNLKRNYFIITAPSHYLLFATLLMLT